MEVFFQDILSYLLLYKYVALFVVTFLAAFALPLPSTTSLMTAAGFASQGYLNISLVIFSATLGNVVADNVAYWAARHYGVTIFQKVGFNITETPVFYFIVKALAKHSRGVIFWSRFEVIMTITVNVFLGITKFDYQKFFFYGLLGETSQVLVFASIGYFFGSSLEGGITVFERIVYVLIICVFVVLFFFRKRFMLYLNNQQRGNIDLPS
ncbi:MAG: VTT domain-containing protein [Candidatus Moranbacteria bacterium]|nr:VTT domain-containing protein [Candidatus Moranbacteria bacterium]